MAEVDSGDALQAQIDAAVLADDMALADSLYQRQIGSTGLARSREPGEPVVEVPVLYDGTAEGEAEAPAPSEAPAFPVEARALEGLEPLPVSEVRAQLSESLAGAEALRKFPEFDSELPFAQAEGVALLSGMGESERTALLDAFGDLEDAQQVRVLRALASRGRQNALIPGDPTSISNIADEGKKMTTMNTKQIEAQIATLEAEMDTALALGDSIEAQDKYQKQQSLYRLLPGGGGAIVGSEGRTL